MSRRVLEVAPSLLRRGCQQLAAPTAAARTERLLSTKAAAAVTAARVWDSPSHASYHSYSRGQASSQIEATSNVTPTSSTAASNPWAHAARRYVHAQARFGCAASNAAVLEESDADQSEPSSSELAELRHRAVLLPQSDYHDDDDDGDEQEVVCEIDLDREYIDQFTLRATDVSWPVQAYYIARNIDTRQLVEQAFPRSKQHNTPKDSNNCVVIALDGHEALTAAKQAEPSKYLVVYTYGAVVGFKVSEDEMQHYLSIVEQYTMGLDKDVSMVKEEYQVVVRPELETWSKYDPRADFLLLQTLDVPNIRIISSVLALSVALNRYERKVDSVLKQFGTVNDEMQDTGTFSLKKKQVFQMVATINNVFTDALHKIRVMERSELAWESAKYNTIWELLRKEFEIANRYATMKDKLDLVQHNLRFFLEVIQNRKSDFLEWTIIWLIALEICVSCWDLFTRSHAADAVQSILQ